MNIIHKIFNQPRKIRIGICKFRRSHEIAGGYKTMEYKVDDRGLDASVFISFVHQIWKGEYDIEKTQKALSQTINITAYSDSTLVRCLRILSDSYYFGTITES